MRLNTNEYSQYYAEQLAVGQEFQDFVQDIFHSKLGLSVGMYQSKKYQIEKGENRAGVEIKRDGKFRGTGNLYIELAEKSRPRSGQMAKSGINREDNTWLYVIGDEQTIFVFSKAFLVCLSNSGKYRIVENGYGTSRGMLLPLTDAMKYAAKVISEGEQ